MRKIFTFLFAALMSVGMYATTTVTWNSSTLSSIDLITGESFTEGGVTLTVLDGKIDGTRKWSGNSPEASFKFSTSLGNFTKIEITAEIRGLEGSGWTQASPGAVWTGEANETTFGIYFRNVTQIVFTIGEPAPTTYTLQLVADPEKGSVAVTNLLGSDIVDNGNGNYTVPENTKVTILATPNEGYVFSGWLEGNVLCDFIDCGTALNTLDNPLTFTLTQDAACKAEFAAVAPQPAATVVTITNNDFPGMDVSFTKDGVTVSADWIDNMQSGNLVAPGSFSTTLGNFTKIEVNAGEIGSLGEGWSGNSERQTWTGNASSVSFSGEIYGVGHGITIMFTIEAAAPAKPTLTLSDKVSILGMPIAGITDLGTNNYEVEPGTQFQIQAAVPEHYNFVGWSDLDTTDPNYSANPRTITINSDLTIKPMYALEAFTITLTSNDTTMGKVTLRAGSGGGEDGDMSIANNADLEGANTSRNIAVGADGSIHVVYKSTEDQSVKYIKSIDGVTFTEPVTVANGAKECEVAVSSNGKVYVSYYKENDGGYIAYSADGTNFTNVKVDNNAASIHMATDGDYVYAVNKPGTNFYYSSDGGQTYNMHSDWSEYMFSDVMVDPLNHNVVVIKDMPEVVVRYSTDHGATFTEEAPVMVQGGNDQLAIFFSTATMGDGKVYMAGADAFVAIIDYKTATCTKTDVNLTDNRSLCADPVGNVIVGVEQGENLYYQLSTNSAVSFGENVLVSNGSGANAALNYHDGTLLYLFTKDNKLYLATRTGIVPTESVVDNGDGTYAVQYGTEVTFTAKAKPGYHVESWSNAVEVNDIIVATQTLEVNSAMTIGATFAANPILTIATNDSTKGIVSLGGAGQGEPITVRWNNSDISGSGNSFTKDGVTITCGDINWDYPDFYGNGTFTTDLGNFTKIEVTADMCEMDGAGWTYDVDNMTWTGNATSVSFNGGMYIISSIVFTIEPAAPATEGIIDLGGGQYSVVPGTELTFVAQPAEEHYLVSWNGEAATSDTLKLTMTEALAVNASFAHVPYIYTLPEGVSIVEPMPAGITSKGEGVYEVEYGTEFQITAVGAPEHYHFDHWADLSAEDAQYYANPRTIVASENLTIEPIFAIDTYIVTLASNDETMGTLRVEGAGGSNIGPKEEINIYHGVVGEHYQVLGEYSGSSWIGVGGNDNKTITVESLNGEIIDNITLEVYMPSHWTGYSIASTSGTVSGDVANYQDLVITNINATSVTLSRVGEGENGGSVLFSEIIVNGRDEQQGGQAEPITVTWNSYDLPSYGSSFTKDGVTLTCTIDESDLYGPGTFTTDLGNFTKIEVTAYQACIIEATGGWSGNTDQMTWTGNAASVSWDGSIYGFSSDVTIVFTIEPTAAPAAATGIVDNGDGTYTVDWGTEMSIIAEPKEGFMLESWSNGAAVTGDTLKLTMTEELSLTANFKHIPATITLPEGVSIVGMPIEGITSKGEGVYEVEYGTEFQISADIIPEHYHFGHWADLDAEDAMYAANPRTIVAGENLTIEPIFAIDTYTLTLATNDSTKGVVSLEGAGQGGEPEPFAQLIVPESWSSEVGVTITAADFPGFVASTEEAVKALPVPTEGSVFVIYNFKEEVDPSGGAGNASVEAVTFENGEYVRTTSTRVDHANTSYYSNQGMIFLYTTAAGQAGQGGEGEEPEGIVDNGDGTYTVDWGTELTFTAKAADGYHVESWSNGAEVNDLVEATQTITMTEALDLSALFAANPIITLATNDSTMGIVTLAGAGNKLTVAGSNMDVNQNIPIRPVSSTDTRTMNQSIYPAAMLTGIAGESISGMTYYISEPGAHVLTATYVVKLMETEQAAFSDAVAVNTESATTVYTGTIDVTGNTLDIVFDQPYAYNGGNLLVEFSISSASHQNALAKFSVFASQGGSFQQYYNFGFEEMRYYTYDFLAKTTFICGGSKGIPGVIDLGNGQYNVLPGTELTFVAQPAERFMLDSWSNGAPVNGDSLTITVTEPLSLTANFKYIPAVITLPEGVNIVEPVPAGITALGEGVYEVEHDTEFQITAVGAPEHYHFDHWADLVEEDAMYTINPRTIVAGENLTVEPFYAIDTYIVTLASNDETMGTLRVEGVGEEGEEPFAQLIVPESWSSEVGVTITADDLPGFVASTEEAVKALPVPTEGSVFVIYNFKEEVDPSGGAGNASVEAVTFENGEYVRTTSSPVDHASTSYYSKQGMTYFYTTAAGQAGQGGEGEEPEGIVDNGDGTYTVDWGTELSIVAVPAEDYHLVSWNGEPATSDTLKVTVTDELSVSTFFKHDTYILTVEGVEVKNAKFADGTADVEVLNPGTLVGVQTGDNVQLTTTATFSSAAVGDNLTITVHYAIEVIDGGIYDNEYALAITDSILEIKGFIIEPMTPDEDAMPEDQATDNKGGFDIYTYGYCKGNDIGFKFHLNSGKPDQYKIEFDKSKCDAICFTDIDWTDLEMEGNDGEVFIDIPMDMPTGDYSMTVTFRDSRFDLKSDPITVPFHVNLSETYVVALFDNVMAVVDTCECLTDIQWYWRADASQPWTMIEGATGYYYKQEGGLSGEYFIHAKMNGVDTYTCPQEDLSLYGDTKQAKVRAYPNLVDNATTVIIENSYNYEHTLRVVNLMGNEMMITSFKGNTTSVEMGTFPQGHYMISVDGITVKVMKQ